MPGDYFIKPGYQHRDANRTIETRPGQYWTPRRIRLSRHTQHAVYQTAVDLIGREKLRSVLDVGCGSGVKMAAMLAPLGIKAVGVDQASIIAEARRLHPSCEFIAVDLEQPNQPPHEAFDLILCVDVIEHLSDPDVLLDYIRSHAHEVSYVVISTPERDVVRGADNVRSPKDEHVRERNRDESRYLSSRGFAVLRHELMPSFKLGWSWTLIRNRLRMLRKGIPFKHNQMAVCRIGR